MLVKNILPKYRVPLSSAYSAEYLGLLYIIGVMPQWQVAKQLNLFDNFDIGE